MSISIGLRAHPKEVYFAIIKKTKINEFEIVTVESIKVPVVLDMPEKLRYLRQNILDTILLYKVKTAGLRIAEAIPGQKPDMNRIAMESVLQETIAGSTIAKFYTGRMNYISSKLNITSKEFKNFIEGSSNYENIQDWNLYSTYQRESILSSIAAHSL